eukprot:TRINITY_DN10668_c0_g1_i2.p1 TRINITY_DN10668_c0_g1~~TRINITY_DN10668_c0_g1_i2.p1  ORF type:complete len:366 (-),score=84.67 TRINITY_DN10668_c0_g1_i2:84-1181(-)
MLWQAAALQRAAGDARWLQPWKLLCICLALRGLLLANAVHTVSDGSHEDGRRAAIDGVVAPRGKQRHKGNAAFFQVLGLEGAAQNLTTAADGEALRQAGDQRRPLPEPVELAATAERVDSFEHAKTDSSRMASWASAVSDLSPVEQGSIFLNVVFIVVLCPVCLAYGYGFGPQEQRVQVDKHSWPAETCAAIVDMLKEERRKSSSFTGIETLAFSKLRCTVRKSTSKSTAHWHKGFKERYVAVVPAGGPSPDGSEKNRLELWYNSYLAWWEARDDFLAWTTTGTPAPKGSLSIAGVHGAYPLHEKDKEGFVLLKHRSEIDEHDMHIVFETLAQADDWAANIMTVKQLLSGLGDIVEGSLEDFVTF